MAKELVHADRASKEMVKRAAEQEQETVWDRYEKMQPQCGFGNMGICCRICSMGPCRIDPFGEGTQTGICGANADTIVARNLIRMIAGGAAAHSDHGRDIAHTLLMAATDPNSDYEIKDPVKLRKVAEVYDIAIKGRDDKEIAVDLARACLAEFGKSEGEVTMASTAPEARQKVWRDLGVFPRAVDREIVEIMHRTHIGVDCDYKNLIRHGMRASLADGWGGSMVATEVSDILFGSPNPLRSCANLGVLKEDTVNLIVHGHEPTFSDVLALVSQKQELIDKAKAAGAAGGLTVGGICCTANEILMRHGFPVIGSFLQQELAIMTGAVELMVVDVQCIMPSLSELSMAYHTKLITISPKAKIPGAEHIEFKEDKAVEIATQIIELSIENFANRKKKDVYIPDDKEDMVAGFTTESVFQFLGGKYRGTYRPLNDGIISGRLRGAAGVVGCSNPNIDFEEGHIKMVKELLANDVLVVTTGCNAVSCGKHGLLRPEAAMKYAGKGLQEICETVGIPPVLHLGSCVDNSRILRVLANIVAEGGLGEDISDLPGAGAAPEWMSEKAVSIGFYFVASGVYTIIGHPLPVEGSEAVMKYITDEIEEEVGGKWAFELDPVKAAHKMIDHIDKKRQALKLKPPMYEQAYPFAV
ncbi:anaerobic carbon-monoxide dehydrogenase catalytic subunit [candidate division KSB1 bacterium]|nr:anaerobic carbon-monoxide dehydrogenase catalytic subunit [candidate division KSB1 bacterium]